MRRFDLDLLHALVSVADSGSFTKALNKAIELAHHQQ